MKLDKSADGDKQYEVLARNSVHLVNTALSATVFSLSLIYSC